MKGEMGLIFSMHGGLRNIYKILVGKPKKNYLGSWENNIKMDLKYTVCDGVDWIKMVEDRVQWRFTV
jgi:hypothetical protein